MIMIKESCRDKSST